MSYETIDNLLYLALYAIIGLSAILAGGLLASGLEAWHKSKRLRKEYRYFKKTWRSEK